MLNDDGFKQIDAINISTGSRVQLKTRNAKQLIKKITQKF